MLSSSSRPWRILTFCIHKRSNGKQNWTTLISYLDRLTIFEYTAVCFVTHCTRSFDLSISNTSRQQDQSGHIPNLTSSVKDGSSIYVKMTINSLILDSGIRADCEVFGLFRDIIPVEALNEEEGLRFGRGRQGLLPDFRLDLPGQGGGPGALGQVESKLAVLKPTIQGLGPGQGTKRGWRRGPA